MTEKSIFISHSTQDKAWADRLCDKLESVGIPCWIAPRDIQPGKNWASSIVGAINDCSILVLLVSDASLKSKYVLREVELADNKGKTLISVRLDDVSVSGGFEFFLSLPQSINCFRSDFDSLMPNVITAVTNNLPDFHTDISEVNSDHIWHTLSQDGLFLVMGRHNTESGHGLMLVDHTEVMALYELNSYLHKISKANPSFLFADQMNEDLLSNNLVLIGGPNINNISREFLKIFHLNFEYSGYKCIDKLNNRDYSATVDQSIMRVTRDYGVIVFVENPFNTKKHILFLSGILGYGSWAAIRHVISYQFLQSDLVRNLAPLECLVEVSVKNETPQTIKPIIMRKLN